jgi:hypothetical protein
MSTRIFKIVPPILDKGRMNPSVNCQKEASNK